MGDLALTFRDLGRAAEAEELQQQGYEISKRVLGPEHPDTLIYLNNLAVAMHSVGKTSDALALMLLCYELRKKKIGATHPLTQGTFDIINRWQRE
jgi:hypothetical protein